MIESVSAKTILLRSKYERSDWFGVDFTATFYRGCEHGCIYCDGRSNCYGMKYFDRMIVKENAPEILLKELRRKRAVGIVGLNPNADSYNPYEEDLGITRRILEAIARCRFGVSIETKSPLVVRDADVLRSVAAGHSAMVKVTVTTTDENLVRILEPHAPPVAQRFKALRELSDNGVFCGVMMTPIIPFVTDTVENVLDIVERAHENGAKFVYTQGGLSMRDGQREYFLKKSRRLSGDLPNRYAKTYGASYYCYSNSTKTLIETLRSECEKRGMLHRMEDIIAANESAHPQEQISLF